MSLNWKDLEEILDEPIAYRFIDKVERLSGNVAEAIKLVSTQDWYFTMHFPGNPVVPGVFLLEMMKQTAIVVLRSLDFCFDRTGLFECERFRIFQEVRPGDIVRIVVRLERITDGIRGRFSARIVRQCKMKGFVSVGSRCIMEVFAVIVLWKKKSA